MEYLSTGWADRQIRTTIWFLSWQTVSHPQLHKTLVCSSNFLPKRALTQLEYFDNRSYRRPRLISTRGRDRSWANCRIQVISIFCLRQDDRFIQPCNASDQHTQTHTGHKDRKSAFSYYFRSLCETPLWTPLNVFVETRCVTLFHRTGGLKIYSVQLPEIKYFLPFAQIFVIDRSVQFSQKKKPTICNDS